MNLSESSANYRYDSRLLRFARPSYDKFVRPLLPYAKVQRGPYTVVGAPKILDFSDRVNRDHEIASRMFLRRAIQPGDSVGVIGGGMGVTAMDAARWVGDSGNVTVYEAGERQIEILKRNLQLNDINGVSIEHAVVGENIHTYTPVNGAPTISANELPQHDVLEIDAEGAELKIVSELQSSHRELVVEIHPDLFGVDVSEVIAAAKPAYELLDTDKTDPDQATTIAYFASSHKGGFREVSQ